MTSWPEAIFGIVVFLSIAVVNIVLIREASRDTPRDSFMDRSREPLWKWREVPSQKGEDDT